MLQCSITVMVGSGPHQTNPRQAESANVRQQDEFLNLEREKDLDNYQEGSLHTVHTSGSGFRRKGPQFMSKVMKKPCNERLTI